MSIRDIRILGGDCRKELLDIQDESIHLIITDPPYFYQGLDADWNPKMPEKSGAVGGLPVGMKFDVKQGVRLQEFMEVVAAQLYRVAYPGAVALVFSAPRLSHRMALSLENCGFEIRDSISWQYSNKSQFKAFSMEHFIKKMDCTDEDKNKMSDYISGRKTIQLRSQHETLILAQKPKHGTLIENYMRYGTGLMDSKATLDGKSPSNVMRVDKPKKDNYNKHLTVKPVTLIEHLIHLFSRPGQTVLDPFLGSGTTAVACLNLGRKFIGMEVSEEFLSLALKRLDNSVQPEDVI